jgi:cobalt-zinc-cadmium efflux system protein
VRLPPNTVINDEGQASLLVAPAPDHGHGHIGRREVAAMDQRRLVAVACAGALVVIVELVAGWRANSLVLLADAGHYATDLASVLLALAAVRWSLKPATERKSFGHHRSEVVAAFVQAIALWAVSAVFLVEAVRRIRDPPDVQGPLVAAIGALTLAVNAALAYALRAGSGRSLNIRAAYLHILSDVLGSAAAVVAGALVALKGWTIADPLLTIVVTVLILVFTFRLTRQTLHILLEGTPHDVPLPAVERALLEVPGVREVHDLHVWSQTSGMNSLTAHVVLDAAPADDHVMHLLHDKVRKGFPIDHITIQVESPAHPCDTLRHAWPRPAV